MRPQNFKFSLIVAGVLAGIVPVHADPILWYNGDDISVGGTMSGGGAADEVTSNLGYYRAYDDFNISGPMWQVTSIWCNNAIKNAGVTQASWEIRSGMAPGNGGTIIASGSAAATLTPTGRSINSVPEYSVSVNGLDLFLAPGTYWLNVSPLVGSDPSTGGSFDSYTSFTFGANAIGTPPGNNANGLLDWTGSYSPFLAIGFDLSMGVAGTVVPEPSIAWLVLMGCGFLVCLRGQERSSTR